LNPLCNFPQPFPVRRLLFWHDCFPPYSVLRPAFRLGGMYPASFALRLAACRRSSLYGSRMETQRFGTTKQCSSFCCTCFGYFSVSRFSFSKSFGSWV